MNPIPNYYGNESFSFYDTNNNISFNSVDNTTEIFFVNLSSSSTSSALSLYPPTPPWPNTTKPVIIEWNSIKWLLTMYSIIFLLATIGNSLVILTLVQNKRMRTITNVYLLNLAISDLFLGVFCMPFTLVGMILRNFIFGGIMCKLLPYLQGEIRTQTYT